MKKVTRRRLVRLAFVLLIFGGHLRAAQLLPDLTINPAESHPHVVYRTFAANDCTVNEGCAQAGTRRLLMFATVTRNIGTADLIMGDPSTNSLFYFDPCHGHYHYTDFAEYRLRRSDGSLVVEGHKIGFCLEDIEQWDPAASASRRYDCTYQGIQKGWADVYTEDTPCQWIDITGLPGGDYILEMETNPARHLPELNYDNNVAQIAVSFGDDCGTIPANDSFSDAQAITRLPMSFRAYNACASKQPGEPNHAGDAGGHSLWYHMVAPSNGLVRVTTEGSDFDTLLAVYRGTSFGTLMLVTNNDDVDPNTHWSRLSFTAVGGADYKIAVDGYGGGVGLVVLSINPPTNDRCTNCVNLIGNSGNATGWNVGATKEPGEPDHSANIGGHSVWWCWTAGSSGEASFDTIGSDYDTTLGVYTGNAVNALTLVGGDNDSAGNFKSRVTLNAVAGTVYRIGVDGVSGATGNITLNWFRPTRLSIARLSATAMQITLGAAQGTYQLQASANLTNWTILTTMTLTGSAQQYTDNNAGLAGQRFYRAIGN